MINKNIITLAKEAGIKMDQLGSILFVIKSMYDEQYELLDAFDDSNTNRNSLIIYKEAEKLALLKRDKEGTKTHYILSYTGKKFWETVVSLSSSEDGTYSPAEKMSTWISEWVNLWKDENGVFFRDKSTKRTLGVNERDAFEQMTAFMKRYNYIFVGKNPKEIVMEATKMYVNEFKKNSFVFCKGAYYFIMKEENRILRSTLAEWCENYINRVETPPPSNDDFYGFAAN